MNAVTELPFETAVNWTFTKFFPPKVQIWVILTPGAMQPLYTKPKRPLSKMGGQRGQNAPQITLGVFKFLNL